jgi:hypothetical protein
MTKIPRPLPPDNIGTLEGDYILHVAPALDMPMWVQNTFIAADSALHNPEHLHLTDALEGQIGFLWASGGYLKQGRHIIGLTEPLVFRSGYWQKMRAEQQFAQWFGMNIPEFIITLDADYCRQCGDVEFCALVEHELYHIAHDVDKMGAPAFHRDTGKPKLTMRGHDVEEFVGVVRRYGMSAEVAKLVDAANKQPEVARVDIAAACGTCLKLVA